MKNGSVVKDFEDAFAEYVGARHAIAHNSGTSTLHTALIALGVKPGDRVATTPLTMAATSIAILHAGAVPVFVDVDPETWLMKGGAPDDRAYIGVSLYGLHWPGSWYDYRDGKRGRGLRGIIDDAAQTLAPFSYGENEGWPDFKSYSFQASKILPLGEGGMLCTNDDDLAQRAREFSSLGYRMPNGPKIDPATLKSPTYARHHSLGWNYRMSDLVAHAGLHALTYRWAIPGTHYGEVEVARLRRERLECAALYREAIEGCDWLTPQHIPDGWSHDMWTFAVATDTWERCLWLLDAMERHGGERPYPAWRLTYMEPAFAYLEAEMLSERLYDDGSICPVAESIQPRLVQFQTNDLASAERNAKALRRCIEEVG